MTRKWENCYLTFIDQASRHLPGDWRKLVPLFLGAVAGDAIAELALWDVLREDGLYEANYIRLSGCLTYGKEAYAKWSREQKRWFHYYLNKRGF
jgi:hypothetical protein